MIEVVCVKVGTKYGPEYVNRLGSMVRRNLSLEHTFHCITDDAAGVEANILDVEETQLPGWWQKLSVFKPDPWGLKNPIMFLDLDLVILRSLDDFADSDHDFKIIKDYKHFGYNSSVFWLKPGTRVEVWNDFTPDVMGRFASDQNWIKNVIPDAELWPKGWVVSYKHSIRRRGWFNREPADEARVVIFHGNPKPHDVRDRFVHENWR